jgi:branched-chain amino acid aminotransferase
MQNIDPRNENILVYIDGHLMPREEAKISVFDSAVQGGDAVWEGLRVYKGKIAALDGHLERLH